MDFPRRHYPYRGTMLDDVVVPRRQLREHHLSRQRTMAVHRNADVPCCVCPFSPGAFADSPDGQTFTSHTRTAAPCQFYFARRVWKFSQSLPLYWTIITLSVANTTMGIVATAFAFTHAE